MCDYEIGSEEYKINVLYPKLVNDVTNEDLAILGYPDFKGSFMCAFIEDVLKLKCDEVKNTMTYLDFINAYEKYKRSRCVKN